MTATLGKRQMLAQIARPFALAYSRCYRCGMPWKFTDSHTTYYGDGSHGCFPLCEPCWSELTPDERLPFYERLIVEWNAHRAVAPEDRRAILEAVRLGG